MTAPTQTVTRQHPFRMEHAGVLPRLRRALEAAGYDHPTVRACFPGQSPTSPLDVAAALRRTAGASPLDTLVRLFVLARPVPEEAAREALDPADPDELVALGLLDRTDGEVRGAAALIPFEDLHLIRDFWPEVIGGEPPRDYVLGVGPASLTVAQMTVRRTVDAALDLGTGNGIQALLAARHARRVVGTDTNGRALAFAGLNCRLNEVSNVELAAGSLFEPVAGQRFDLVVANPPFVISPKAEYEYRDGGRPGDVMSEETVRGAAEHLREGGFASVLCNWHHAGDEDWAERPIAWIRHSGCDCWIVGSETVDPLLYASKWLAPVRHGNPAEYARRLDDWMGYFEALGIGRITSGTVLLRRRSAPSNWIRKQMVAETPDRPCGDQIERIFAAETLLQEAGSDADLLDKSLRLVADHQLEPVLRAEGGQWAIQRSVLRQTGGLRFDVQVDELGTRLAAGLDGRRTLREALAEACGELDAPLERVTPACTAAVRSLLRLGFLAIC